MRLVENFAIKGEKKKEIAFPNIKISDFIFVVFSNSPERFLFSNNDDNIICLLYHFLKDISSISN